MAALIFIVDDSQTIRFHVRQSLEANLSTSLEVVEAQDGFEALQKLILCAPCRFPDVIVLDRNMPNLTGDEFIRILKQDPSWEEIPVLFLTTHSEIQEVVKGLSTLQADDYLGKPFDPQELAARVKVLIRMKQAEDQMRAALLEQKRAYQELKETKVQLAVSEKIVAMTQTFEKFVPKQFLSRLATEGIETIELGQGKNDFLSMLFCDIRAFTAISESMAPESLLEFLNSYFTAMTEQISQNHGFVDKFVGDAVLALFDRPDESDFLEATDAVNAAIGMQNALKDYNRDRRGLGFPPIAIGIGVHSGPVVIGTVGVRDRMISTALGDSVNVAARIESATKIYGAGILISNTTFQYLLERDSYHYREVDWIRVKGKSEPVGVYEILDADPPELQELKQRVGTLLEKVLVYRKKQKWTEALAACQEALGIYPKDRVVKFHLRQLQKLQKMKIPSNWDGAISLLQK